jgi:hypothetical protein
MVWMRVRVIMSRLVVYMYGLALILMAIMFDIMWNM